MTDSHERLFNICVTVVTVAATAVVTIGAVFIIGLMVVSTLGAL